MYSVKSNFLAVTTNVLTHLRNTTGVTTDKKHCAEPTLSPLLTKSYGGSKLLRQIWNILYMLLTSTFELMKYADLDERTFLKLYIRSIFII